MKRAARREFLSDASLHALLGGDIPMPSTGPHRLPGWPDAVMLSMDALRAIWEMHRAALTEEARAAGFVPAAAVRFDHATDTAASRTARARWSQRFYQQRGY